MSIKIRDETFWLIAKDISDRATGSQFLNIFRREGVPDDYYADYPKTKSWLIHDVLVSLQSANTTEQYKVLLNLIVKFAHPLTFDGSLTESRKTIDKFNSWLEFDGLSLYWSGKELKISEAPSAEEMDRMVELADRDYDTMTSEIVLKRMNSLREYANGYRTLISIVEEFYSKLEKPEEKLNEYYIKLVNFLKILNDVLFQNSNVSFSFEELFIPHKNLFTAYSDLAEFRGEQIRQGSQILSKMNKYYGEISELLLELELKSTKQSPGGDLIKEIQAYVGGSEKNTTAITKDEILSYGDLSLNLDKATLQYRDSKPKGVSTETNPIKYLRLLMVKDGSVLPNVEAVKELKLTSIEDGDKNTDFSGQISTLRRDLITLLVEVGMVKDEATKLIESVAKVGYKLAPIEKS